METATHIMQKIEEAAHKCALLDPIVPSMTALHVDSEFRKFLAKKARGAAAAYLFCCRVEGIRADLKMLTTLFFVPDLLLGFYTPAPVTGATPCPVSAHLALGPVVRPISLQPGQFVPALKSPDGRTIAYPLQATWYSDAALVRNEADAQYEVWAVFALCSHVGEIRDTYWDLPGTGMFVRHGNIRIGDIFLRPGQEMPTLSTDALMNLREGQRIAMDNVRVFEEELIQKAWHPSRFVDWCLDEEEKKHIEVQEECTS